MRADDLINNQKASIQNESQTLCQWEQGAYQALGSMALALKTEGVSQESIARAVQTSLDALTRECPEDNHTEQLVAAHELLSHTSVQETIHSLIDDALMDHAPQTARELVKLIERSAAPMDIDQSLAHDEPAVQAISMPRPR